MLLATFYKGHFSDSNLALLWFKMPPFAIAAYFPGSE